MTLRLYAHPFSSYCQKVVIALREVGMPYELRQLGGDPAVGQQFVDLWPLKKMPVLCDGDRVLREATIIVEYVHLKAGAGSALLPADSDAVLNIRFLDRVFDNYIMTPIQRIVSNHMRKPERRDPLAVDEAHALLDTAYDWLETHLASHAVPWVGGADFSLADCAAAPSLFYADWVRPIGRQRPCLQAYRARLLARPSVKTAVDDARPFRHLFPPGAPDRD